MQFCCPREVRDAMEEEQKRLALLEEWRAADEEALFRRMIRDISARLRWGGERDE